MNPPSPPGEPNGTSGSPDASDKGSGPNTPDEGSGDDGGDGEAGTEVLLTLPDDLRRELGEPFGPVFTDARELLAGSEGPIVAVGDVVTYHLTRAGGVPEVAVLDGYTERTPVDEAVHEGTDTDAYDERVAVANPAATLTAAVLGALADALAGTKSAGNAGRKHTEGTDGGGQGDSDVESTVIAVDGEEDLLTLPAIVAAPDGASVVYGQPGEGMVRVPVDEENRARARGLVDRMDGDHERAWDLLGVRSD